MYTLESLNQYWSTVQKSRAHDSLKSTPTSLIRLPSDRDPEFRPHPTPNFPTVVGGRRPFAITNKGPTASAHLLWDIILGRLDNCRVVNSSVHFLGSGQLFFFSPDYISLEVLHRTLLFLSSVARPIYTPRHKPCCTVICLCCTIPDHRAERTKSRA